MLRVGKASRIFARNLFEPGFCYRPIDIVIAGDDQYRLGRDFELLHKPFGKSSGHVVLFRKAKVRDVAAKNNSVELEAIKIAAQIFSE
ncbi:MAG: hypothetical protein QOF14_4422 [Hyphomicrobiales bacterium]|nr:hypothetical protein [Hyphomicrobiales bacterium]